MHVLFVTQDYIGERRAGPAIRTVELARVLSRHHEVTVVSSGAGEIALSGIQLISNVAARPNLLREAFRSSDIVVTQGLTLLAFPFLKRAKNLVVEIYDPYLFESLVHRHARFPSWAYLRQWYALNEQLEAGDFFICANEKQWDYWLGRLCALGRLSPQQYSRDPTFRSLMDVIPFGIPSDPPLQGHPRVKGVVPGISPTDLLLLWAGGIWQWFDPLTLIRALREVGKQRSDIKLLFLGVGHPNPDSPHMPIVEQTRQLARELGLLDRSVFFHDGWVPQAEMQSYLTEADIGVATYLDIIETRFAFRTRVRDYIWANIPMILTRGDSFAELVEQQQLGRTVAAGDVAGLRTAILELAANPQQRQEIRQKLAQLAPQYQWEKVAEPLLRYCNNPYRSPGRSRWRQRVVPLLSRAYQLGYQLISRFHASNNSDSNT